MGYFPKKGLYGPQWIECEIRLYNQVMIRSSNITLPIALKTVKPRSTRAEKAPRAVVLYLLNKVRFGLARR